MNKNKTTLKFSVDILIPNFYIDYINSTSDRVIDCNDLHKKINLDKLVEKFKILINEEYQSIYKSYI